MPPALLRVSLTVALMAERDTVAQAVREVWSLCDWLYMVCNLCRYHASVPLAVLTEVFIPAHDRRRPIAMPLLVVRRVR